MKKNGLKQKLIEGQKNHQKEAMNSFCGNDRVSSLPVVVKIKEALKNKTAQDLSSTELWHEIFQS